MSIELWEPGNLGFLQKRLEVMQGGEGGARQRKRKDFKKVGGKWKSKNKQPDENNSTKEARQKKGRAGGALRIPEFQASFA